MNHISYQAPGEGGESWTDVRNRFLSFSKELKDGNYLIFTHGGLIVT